MLLFWSYSERNLKLFCFADPFYRIFQRRFACDIRSNRVIAEDFPCPCDIAPACDKHLITVREEERLVGTGVSCSRDAKSTDILKAPALAPADSLSLSSLSNIASMKQELYHIGTSGYGVQILCENIFYKDDVLFLLISVRNSSAVSYELATPRFAVESAKRTKRGLQYEKAVFPRASYGLGAVAPDSVGKLVFTFDKIALVKGQVFRVYFYEKGGARNLVVTMNGKDVNGARRL